MKTLLRLTTTLLLCFLFLSLLPAAWADEVEYPVYVGKTSTIELDDKYAVYNTMRDMTVYLDGRLIGGFGSSASNSVVDVWAGKTDTGDKVKLKGLSPGTARLVVSLISKTYIGSTGQEFATSTNTLEYRIVVSYDGYVISFSANDGYNTPDDLITDRDGKITLSGTPTKEGYNFLGWSESSTATKPTYSNGQTCYFTRNTTLFAIWKFDHYVIKYSGNGEGDSVSNVPGNQSKYPGNAIRLSETVPTRRGCRFMGWRSGSSGNVYDAGDSFSKDGFITLYAVWEKIPVEGIALNKSSFRLPLYNEEQMTVLFTPEEPYNKKITWSSSNPEIATVENGLVKSIAPGTTTITATSEDGGFTASCAVEVYYDAYADFTVDSRCFPDAGFLSSVSALQSAADGKLTWSERWNITGIDCSGKSINSLEGIQHFSNLRELNCGNNQLSALDLTQNTRIKTLNCSGNKLTSLLLYQYSSIETLDCHSNQLTALDTGKLWALRSLDCGYNRLSMLDLGESTQLETLNCKNNSLSGLNVQNKTALTAIDCANNGLSTLKLSGCTALKTLDCSKNSLTFLNAGGLGSLQTLNCSENNLSEMNLNGCDSLSELNCASNSLTVLDIDMLPVLWKLDCGSNQLTELFTEGNTHLSSVQCKGNALIYLVLRECPNLSTLQVDYGALEVLDLHGCVILAWPKEGYNAYTSTLSISAPLRSIDLTGLRYLRELSCYSYLLENLNVSGCTYLQRINCPNGKLTSLDLSGCSELKYLSSQFASTVDSLNLSGANFFDYISMNTSSTNSSGSVHYGHFDASSDKNKGFTLPMISYTDVNLSNNTKITAAYGYGKVKFLNLQNCYNLNLVSFHNNGLCSLDLTNCNPRILEVQNNNLEYLDLTDCTEITTMLKNYYSYDRYRDDSSDARGGAYYEYLGKVPSYYYSNVNLQPRLDVDVGTTTIQSHYTQIINHPRNVAAHEGATATFKVTASGSNQSYQWFWKAPGGSFEACPLDGAGTDTLTVTVTAERDGWQFRCSVDGYSSDVATLTVLPSVTPAAEGIAVDAAHFPDANFRAYILETLDFNHDSALSNLEIEETTEINCSGKNIASLQGIGVFTGLSKLTCGSNSLTSLDLSINTELTELACYTNQITALDVSVLPKLQRLNAYNNSLQTLNVRGCARLETLYCDENQLTSLDLSGCTHLYALSCSHNNLSLLDVRPCPELVAVCRENEPVAGNDGITRYGYFLSCDNGVRVLYIPFDEAIPDLVLPASLTTICEEAFAGGAFTYAKLSEKTTAIGRRAFADCPKLTYIYIPAATKTIDPAAFGDARGITIIGKSGSTAAAYAQAYGFTFVAVS